MHKAADDVRDEPLIITPPRQVGIRVDLQTRPTNHRLAWARTPPPMAQPSPTAGPFFCPFCIPTLEQPLIFR